MKGSNLKEVGSRLTFVVNVKSVIFTAAGHVVPVSGEADKVLLVDVTYIEDQVDIAGG